MVTDGGHEDRMGHTANSVFRRSAAVLSASRSSEASTVKL